MRPHFLFLARFEGFKTIIQAPKCQWTSLEEWFVLPDVWNPQICSLLRSTLQNMCSEFNATKPMLNSLWLWSIMPLHTDLFGESWSQTWHFPASFSLFVNPWWEERQWALLLVALGLDPTVGLVQGYNTLLTGSCLMIQISEQVQ